MNITHCRTTDVELELDNLISLDEDYTTTPLFTITPILQRPDEEELHMQFEKALQKRIRTSSSHWQRLRRLLALNSHARRVLLHCCCALNCILLGFDLMGLLVLHMR